MSSEEDKDKTSFADPSNIDRKEEDSKKQPQGDYPLFKKLDAIVEAIKEQTKASVELKDALNNLITTFVVKSDKVEPAPSVQVPKETEKRASLADLPYDVTKITFVPCNNGRMAYVDAPANKENKDFKAMQTFLKENNGSVSSKGGLWYRIFDNGSIFEKGAKTEESKQASQTQLPESNTKQPPPLPQPVEQKTTKTANKVEDLFPDDLKDMLSFEDKGDYVTVKPRQFLGSENFAKIASVVRGAGGEYVSAGKASHFRIPNKK